MSPLSLFFGGVSPGAPDPTPGTLPRRAEHRIAIHTSLLLALATNGCHNARHGSQCAREAVPNESPS